MLISSLLKMSFCSNFIPKKFKITSPTDSQCVEFLTKNEDNYCDLQTQQYNASKCRYLFDYLIDNKVIKNKTTLEELAKNKLRKLSTIIIPDFIDSPSFWAIEYIEKIDKKDVVTVDIKKNLIHSLYLQNQQKNSLMNELFSTDDKRNGIKMYKTLNNVCWSTHYNNRLNVHVITSLQLVFDSKDNKVYGRIKDHDIEYLTQMELRECERLGIQCDVKKYWYKNDSTSFACNKNDCKVEEEKQESVFDNKKNVTTSINICGYEESKENEIVEIIEDYTGA